MGNLMIEFDNHITLIQTWSEAGRPLPSSTIEAIIEVANELADLDYEDEWVVFRGQCRICNYEQNIICPAVNDLDNQECYNCGHTTMMIKEIPEWEQEEQELGE